MNLCPYLHRIHVYQNWLCIIYKSSIALLFLFISGCSVHIFSSMKTLRFQAEQSTAKSLFGQSLLGAFSLLQNESAMMHTLAFSLTNATFFKLLGGHHFIIFSGNSYNFLHLTIRLCLQSYFWKLFFELRPLAELLAFTSIYENQNQHLS